MPLAAGLYATWFQDARLDRGWYVDSWTLVGGMNNRVTTVSGRANNDQGQSESSIEVGYTAPIAGGRLLVTPQLQVIANDLMRRTLNDSTGAALSDGGTSWTGRFGLRIAGGVSADQAFAPFLGVNLWRDSNSVTIVDGGSAYSATLPRQRYEIVTGVDWRLSRNAALSTSIKLERGAQSYQSMAAQFALKVAL